MNHFARNQTNEAQTFAPLFMFFDSQNQSCFCELNADYRRKELKWVYPGCRLWTPDLKVQDFLLFILDFFNDIFFNEKFYTKIVWKMVTLI